jgi:hypothetical protein
MVGFKEAETVRTAGSTWAPGTLEMLERSLGRFRGDLTVADAAARGGLALRDTEPALRALASRRGGHIKATEKGELIYSFPDGLVTPPDERRGRRVLRAVGRVLASVARFVVRAWVSVVLIGYALVFLAVLIALAARDDDRDGGMSGAFSMVGRVLFEALFWTFHPFSPLAIGYAAGPMWAPGRARPRTPRVPFYERVNRFVFGPPRPPVDRASRERDLLAEIRRLDGRVGPEDIMRVTGGDREAAERELLRLVVDYEGDIQVSDGGAIMYVFRALRPTAGAPRPFPADPIWSRRATVPPVTGNEGGTNALLVGLNGFNLVMSGVAISAGLTIERLGEVISRAGMDAATQAAMGPLPPPHGLPLVLGWIPFLFSAALFALPIARALARRREAARAADENGRRALLRLVTPGAAGAGLSVLTAADAERVFAAGAAAKPRAGQVEVGARALGADVDVTDDGAVVYRFDTAALERDALARARATAAPDEAQPGRVVFDSEN